jgi:hypothetical protein
MAFDGFWPCSFIYLSFSVALQPKACLGRLIIEASRSRTTRHPPTNTHGKTSLNEPSACRTGRYFSHQQQIQQAKIQDLNGIRPYDRSN